MASLTERVLAMAEGGMTFPLISAILDITPTQVEEAFLGTSLPDPASASLTDPRWVLFDASVETGPPGAQLGIEVNFPVFPPDLAEASAYAYGTGDSSLLIGEAGGALVKCNSFALQQGRVGDSITPNLTGILAQVDGAHWCRFRIDPAEPLTVADPVYATKAADLKIVSQDAANFSLEGAQILSADAGRFICTVAWGNVIAELV